MIEELTDTHTGNTIIDQKIIVYYTNTSLVKNKFVYQVVTLLARSSTDRFETFKTFNNQGTNGSVKIRTLQVL